MAVARALSPAAQWRPSCYRKINNLPQADHIEINLIALVGEKARYPAVCGGSKHHAIKRA